MTGKAVWDLPSTIEECHAELVSARARLTLAGYSNVPLADELLTRPPADTFIVVWNEATEARPLAFTIFTGDTAWAAANVYYEKKRAQWSEVLLLVPVPPAEGEDRRLWSLLASMLSGDRNMELELLAAADARSELTEALNALQAELDKPVAGPWVETIPGHWVRFPSVPGVPVATAHAGGWTVYNHDGDLAPAGDGLPWRNTAGVEQNKLAADKALRAAGSRLSDRVAMPASSASHILAMRSELPKHALTALCKATDAFQNGEWHRLSTVYEPIQRLVDAAVGALRRRVSPEDHATAVLAAYLSSCGDGWTAETRDQWQRSTQRQKLCRRVGHVAVLAAESERGVAP